MNSGIHFTIQQLQTTPMNSIPGSLNPASRLRCRPTNHLLATTSWSSFPFPICRTPQLSGFPHLDRVNQADSADCPYHCLTRHHVFAILDYEHDGTQHPAPNGLCRDHPDHHHPTRHPMRSCGRPSHVAAYAGPELSHRRRHHLAWAGKSTHNSAANKHFDYNSTKMH